MNARPLAAPAKTMSRGSSPTRSVRTTRRLGTSTMLTLSESWFPTQTSSLGGAAPAPRPRPPRRRAGVTQPLGSDVEDLEMTVGGVGDEEPAAIRRERERANRSGLEGHEALLSRGRGGDAAERDQRETHPSPAEHHRITVDGRPS